MEDLGSKIKKIRLDHHLTQHEFSQLFNVSYQAVSKWENNICFPDITILKDICNKFDIDLNELLNNKKTSKNYFKYIANCENFHISGSLAYNNSKSSI